MIVAFLIAIPIGILFDNISNIISGIQIQWNNNNDDNIAYAHFFGATKNIGNYKIIFQTFPFVPFAGENSTLNFSILDKDNSNINNVYAAFVIKEISISRVVYHTPYKFYEFSDITVPYKFQNNTRYVTTLEAKIPGDPKYEVIPLIADFDFAVGSSPVAAFNQIILYYVIPAVILGVIVVVVFYLNKRRKRI